MGGGGSCVICLCVYMCYCSVRLFVYIRLTDCVCIFDRLLQCVCVRERERERLCVCRREGERDCVFV